MHCPPLPRAGHAQVKLVRQLSVCRKKLKIKAKFSFKSDLYAMFDDLRENLSLWTSFTWTCQTVIGRFETGWGLDARLVSLPVAFPHARTFFCLLSCFLLLVWMWFRFCPTETGSSSLLAFLFSVHQRNTQLESCGGTHVAAVPVDFNVFLNTFISLSVKTSAECRGV